MFELQKGRKAALDILMERWESPIKAYIYRTTQSPDWVDELAQETFVKVYINASKFDISRRFSPWIYTIATNLCRNWRRWKLRHPSMPQQTSDDSDGQFNPTDLLEDESARVNEQIETAETGRMVKDCIQQLPENLRSTLILYYYQNLSYCEISEIQKCSVRGVETRLYRARKLMEKRLNKFMVA